MIVSDGTCPDAIETIATLIGIKVVIRIMLFSLNKTFPFLVHPGLGLVGPSRIHGGGCDAGAYKIR